MDIMFLVSRSESAPVLGAFLRACTRRRIDWCCFLTGPAATLANDPRICAALKGSAGSAVCEHSWERFGIGQCAIALGSQTDNSALAATARHIVSL
ncbi:MAG: hypothetical protein ACYDEV_02505 [Acidiferrobacter sp.]